MTEFQALVLGLIQGLSEFLPISSSAHLALTPWFFGWEPGAGNGYIAERAETCSTLPSCWVIS